MTIQEAAMQQALHDDCRKCVYEVRRLREDFGYALWAAQKCARDAHNLSHPEYKEMRVD